MIKTLLNLTAKCLITTISNFVSIYDSFLSLSLININHYGFLRKLLITLKFREIGHFWVVPRTS